MLMTYDFWQCMDLTRPPFFSFFLPAGHFGKFKASLVGAVESNR
jgi:hypothetical protein